MAHSPAWLGWAHVRSCAPCWRPMKHRIQPNICSRQRQMHPHLATRAQGVLHRFPAADDAHAAQLPRKLRARRGLCRQGNHQSGRVLTAILHPTRCRGSTLCLCSCVVCAAGQPSRTTTTTASQPKLRKLATCVAPLQAQSSTTFSYTKSLKAGTQPRTRNIVSAMQQRGRLAAPQEMKKHCYVLATSQSEGTKAQAHPHAAVRGCRGRGDVVLLEGQVAQPRLHHQPDQAVRVEHKLVLGRGAVADDGVPAARIQGVTLTQLIDRSINENQLINLLPATTRGPHPLVRATPTAAGLTCRVSGSWRGRHVGWGRCGAARVGRAWCGCAP